MKGSSRILVRLPNWVGDIVMALPAVQALRAARPGAYLVGIARREHIELARRIVALNAVVEAPAAAGLWQVAAVWQLARRLRAERLDTAVVLAPSFEAALTAWLSGIRHRIGHATDYRRMLLTRAVAARPNRHRSEGYEDLMTALGVQVGTQVATLTLAGDERRYASRFFERGGWSAETRPVFINPAAAKTPRAWSSERFRILTETIVERNPGLRVIVHERAPFEAPPAWPTRSMISLVRGATLVQLAALIERCTLYVGNDSGPMHLASALGVPTVTLYGPSTPRHTGPRSWPSVDGIAVSAHFPCSPCRERFFEECPTPPSPDGRPPCLDELSVDTVVRQVERALARADRAR